MIAYKPMSPRLGHHCLRCGIKYQPNMKLEGNRHRFCGDCRPLATELGWCQPHQAKASV